ncbi:MAG: hypothetical protein EH225_12300 [Calditrichaeota bacterium]|nr:MAG: hypothetical protein EH225_12300 [Calditrichota bacterium]
MKPIVVFLALLFTFLLLNDVSAQVNVNGWLQSNYYTWENFQETQQNDFYQGLQLRISPEKYSNLYANTFLRVARRGDPADWEERIYNLYAHWGIGSNYKLRVGRQFVYHGVVNGTLDAVQLSGRFLGRLDFSLVGGTEATVNRNAKIRDWDNGNVLGGYLSYRFTGRNNIDISYFQKERWSELYWQQVGSTLHGSLSSRLRYYLRFDYNLLKENYQTLRWRLSYFHDSWSLTAEYNSQRPRIFEDSFFNIFQINPFNQIRTAFQFRIKNYDVGLQLLHTVYDVTEIFTIYKSSSGETDDMDLRLIGTVGHRRFGSFGLVYQNGYGGNNIGYFADIRYAILPRLTIRLFNSYYNYERATVNISEDALSFMGGLGYKLKPQLLLEGEIQQSSNNFYENDLRGLVRVTYRFNM